MDNRYYEGFCTILIARLSLLSLPPRRTQWDRNMHTHADVKHTKSIPLLNSSVQWNTSWIQMRSQPAISSPSNHYYPLPPGKKWTKQTSAMKGIVKLVIRSFHYHPLPAGVVLGCAVVLRWPEEECIFCFVTSVLPTCTLTCTYAFFISNIS